MGDPACFLAATCLSCGRFLEPDDLLGDSCPRCHEPLDAQIYPTTSSSSDAGSLSGAE